MSKKGLKKVSTIYSLEYTMHVLWRLQVREQRKQGDVSDIRCYVNTVPHAQVQCDKDDRVWAVQTLLMTHCPEGVRFQMDNCCFSYQAH